LMAQNRTHNLPVCDLQTELANVSITIISKFFKELKNNEYILGIVKSL